MKPEAGVCAASSGLPAVLIFSQTEWGLAWVFAHDLARYFLEKGHAVVFLDPFPKRFPRLGEWRRLVGRLFDQPKLSGFSAQPRPAGMRFITPLTLPDRNRLFSWINYRLLLPGLRRRVLAACPGCDRRLVFAFQPFATPVALAAMLAPSRLIYARRDGYGADPRLKHLRMSEVELEEKADLIVACGQVLAKSSRGAADKVVDIPGLVDYALFFRPAGGQPAGPPLCCYFGHVNERVDLALLNGVARRYRLRVIGRVSVPWFPEGGVEQVGAVPHDQVAGLLAGCDVVVIPYRLGGFFDSIFPYKIFQAFAQGKPVVTTPLPALQPLAALLYFAATADEFVEQIGRAASEGLDVKLRRQELARRHDLSAALGSLRQRLLNAENGVEPS